MGLSVVVDPTGSVCLPRPVVYRDGWMGRARMGRETGMLREV